MISTCKHLKHVLLDQNELEMLPCEMQEMHWLKVLKVSKNNLKNLIFGIREMHELQILDL